MGKTKQRSGEIKKDIRALYKKGADISPRSMMVEDRAFMGRAERMFGSWQKAVEAAGIDYDIIRKTKQWDIDEVKKTIRLHKAKGIEINAKNMNENYNDLYCAGRKYFGTWEKAVEACGFPYSKIKKRSGIKTPRSECLEWSEGIIINEILKLQKKGEYLNSRYIQITHSKLFYAAYEYFGGWRQAIEASGLDYEAIRLRAPKWYKKDIIKRIKELEKSGTDLSSQAMQRKHNSLLVIASRAFGTWDNALRKAGIKPEKVRKRQKWTADKVLLEFRRRKKEKKSLRTYDIVKDDHALYKAGLRYFKSIESIRKKLK